MNSVDVRCSFKPHIIIHFNQSFSITTSQNPRITGCNDFVFNETDANILYVNIRNNYDVNEILTILLKNKTKELSLRTHYEC